ncbi:hypothetical protein [Streptomyces sp. NPDC003395]
MTFSSRWACATAWSVRGRLHCVLAAGGPHGALEILKAQPGRSPAQRLSSGRPPGFNEDRYKKRNTVERAINYLKQSRAVATRYDKRGYVFFGTATAASVVIWLRT